MTRFFKNGSIALGLFMLLASCTEKRTLPLRATCKDLVTSPAKPPNVQPLLIKISLAYDSGARRSDQILFEGTEGSLWGAIGNDQLTWAWTFQLANGPGRMGISQSESDFPKEWTETAPVHGQMTLIKTLCETGVGTDLRISGSGPDYERYSKEFRRLTKEGAGRSDQLPSSNIGGIPVVVPVFPDVPVSVPVAITPVVPAPKSPANR
jgi:hypothetical protein